MQLIKFCPFYFSDFFNTKKITSSRGERERGIIENSYRVIIEKTFHIIMHCVMPNLRQNVKIFERTSYSYVSHTQFFERMSQDFWVGGRNNFVSDVQLFEKMSQCFWRNFLIFERISYTHVLQQNFKRKWPNF